MNVNTTTLDVYKLSLCHKGQHFFFLSDSILNSTLEHFDSYYNMGLTMAMKPQWEKEKGRSQDERHKDQHISKDTHIGDLW